MVRGVVTAIDRVPPMVKLFLFSFQTMHASILICWSTNPQLNKLRLLKLYTLIQYSHSNIRSTFVIYEAESFSL